MLSSGIFLRLHADGARGCDNSVTGQSNWSENCSGRLGNNSNQKALPEHVLSERRPA